MFRDVFASPVKEGENDERRFVFLISTALPGPVELELFRTATQIKSAFFKPIGKRDLTKEWLVRELALKVERYRDMRSLAVYMDTFSEQIRHVADKLREELDQIELHDLTILNSARLEKDSEDLGEYLSWVLSEAFAARIRESAPLLNAAEGVDRIAGTPFEGSLLPKKVLFDFYSEITFAPASHLAHVRFGDVYRCIPAKTRTESKPQIGEPDNLRNTTDSDLLKHPAANDVDATNSAETTNITDCSPAPSLELGCVKNVSAEAASDPNVSGRPGDTSLPNTASEQRADLVLVIAPSCDLQRCADDFDVLCVRGSITKRVEDLHQLLDQTLFGKDADTIRHLLRQDVDGTPVYSTVEWYPKKAKTVPRNVLVDSSRFSRVARLNELFGQEVKEEALRQFGRVGTPVDPSYSTPLGATVKLKSSKKAFRIEESPDDRFVAAISTSGNNQNEVQITLSDPFIAFIQNMVAEVQSADEPPLAEPLVTSLAQLVSTGSRGIVLGKKHEKDYKNGLRLRLVPSFEKRDPIDGNAVVLYPRRRSDEEIDAPLRTEGAVQIQEDSDGPGDVSENETKTTACPKSASDGSSVEDGK